MSRPEPGNGDRHVTGTDCPAESSRVGQSQVAHPVALAVELEFTVRVTNSLSASFRVRRPVGWAPD